MTASFAAARAVLDEAAAARAFPAAVIEVGDATRVIWQQAIGRLTYDAGSAPTSVETVFDLASLTKVLATTPIVMRQVERGALDLDDRVASHLPAWRGADRAAVTIRDLLSHASGLPSHLPLYRDHSGIAEFETAISAVPLRYVPRSQSLYSDLDFILLGAILERVWAASSRPAGTAPQAQQTNTAPLAQQFDALRAQMVIAGDLQFRPPVLWRSRTAPTRVSARRGGLLIGDVDDDNARALGGVAGHAGLFGTAPAVGECARHLLQILGGRTGALSGEMLRTCISKRVDVPGSSRALGWDTMLPSSSCGTRMSPRAFGHTGFTGTSLWIDPERDVYVVLLTNRVHPEPGDAEVIQQVRRDVHDAVMGDL